MKSTMLEKSLVITAKENKFGMVIEQKQSRALKSELTAKVAALLTDTYEVETVQTTEGLYVLIPNDEEGYIPVMLDIKMKPLDVDIETLRDEYTAKQEEKARKEAEKAEKAAKATAK